MKKILISLIVILFGFSSFSGVGVCASSTKSDLEIKLAKYTEYSDKNDLLNLDGFSNYLLDNGDGLSGGVVVYDTKKAVIESSDYQGSASITNDFINLGVLTNKNSEKVLLKDAPILYQAKVKFNEIPTKDPSNGGSIGIGRAVTGQSIELRMQKDSGTYMLAETPNNAYAQKAVGFTGMGEEISVGLEKNLSIILDNNRMSVYIDGKSAGEDKSFLENDNIKIDKIWFSVFTAFCKLEISEMKLIPLIDFKIPEIEIPASNESALFLSNLKIDSSLSKQTLECESKVENNMIWIKTNVSFKFKEINENTLTSILKFNLSIDEMIDNGYIDIVFKRNEKEELYYRLFGDGKISLYKNDEKIMDATILNYNKKEIKISIVSTLTKCMLNVNDEPVLKNDIISSSLNNCLIFKSDKTKANIQELSQKYTTESFFVKPKTEEYPQNDKKADANNELIKAKSKYSLPIFAYVLGGIFIVGGVCLFFIFKKEIFIKK